MVITVAVVPTNANADARVVKFDKDGKLAIDVDSVFQIELNLSDDQGGRRVIAIG
jgi:hypothetical protein